MASAAQTFIDSLFGAVEKKYPAASWALDLVQQFVDKYTTTVFDPTKAKQYVDTLFSKIEGDYPFLKSTLVLVNGLVDMEIDSVLASNP